MNFYYAAAALCDYGIMGVVFVFKQSVTLTHIRKVYIPRDIGGKSAESLTELSCVDEHEPSQGNCNNKANLAGAKPVDGVPALKAQVRALNKDLPSDEILTCEVEIESELDIIREKLDSLDDLTSQTSSRASSLKALNRIQSLAHHLFHRLSRLDSDNDDSIASQLEALQERLDKFLVKLDNIMHHF
ncbi:hypothetical protein evm_011224 [Chilo suppressalis]|nr:hypothetical protein evm_011224 [Chilo suppressalis]